MIRMTEAYVVDFHRVDVGHGYRFQSLTLRRPDPKV
jgi:hypothetical protein